MDGSCNMDPTSGDLVLRHGEWSNVPLESLSVSHKLTRTRYDAVNSRSSI